MLGITHRVCLETVVYWAQAVPANHPHDEINFLEDTPRCIYLIVTFPCLLFSNTASERKDQHDSSTEEETETKMSAVPLITSPKHEPNDVKASSIKEGAHIMLDLSWTT